MSGFNLTNPGKNEGFFIPREAIGTQEAIEHQGSHHPPFSKGIYPHWTPGDSEPLSCKPRINKNLPLKGKNVTALKFWVSLDEPLRGRPKGGMLSEQLYFDKFLVPFLGIGFPLNSASFISTCRQRRVSPCAGGGSASGGYAFPFTESLLWKPRFNGKTIQGGS